MIIEYTTKVVSIWEYIGLVREVGSAGIHEVDAADLGISGGAM